jgi:hypothetical protein
MQEAFTGRINSVNIWYHSVQKVLFSLLLCKNKEIKIYKTKILPVVLDGCENWSFKLSGTHKLREFEKGMLKKIYG